VLGKSQVLEGAAAAEGDGVGATNVIQGTKSKFGKVCEKNGRRSKASLPKREKTSCSYFNYIYMLIMQWERVQSKKEANCMKQVEQQRQKSLCVTIHALSFENHLGCQH
jgi:hypothetical protein